MFVKDSYLLTASHTFELKGMQEVTINIKLIKVPPLYHTLLTGSVFHKNVPIKNAVVKIFDCKYKPLYHTVTDSRGVYRFHNILTPGIYKVVVAKNGYQTSITRKIKIKKNKVVRKSFQLNKCLISTNGILYGKVRKVGSKKPIKGAFVYLKDKYGRVYKTTSNKEGQYIIYNIKPCKYKLIMMKDGYIASKPIALNINKKDRIKLCIDLKEQGEFYYESREKLKR